MLKSIRFRHDKDADIEKKIYQYDLSWTIEQMLYDFLQKTNSKKTLDTDKICFVYGGILNTEKFLNKTVEQVFKSRNNVAVLVKDTADVVGGYNKKYILYKNIY